MCWVCVLGARSVLCAGCVLGVRSVLNVLSTSASSVLCLYIITS